MPPNSSFASVLVSLLTLVSGTGCSPATRAPADRTLWHEVARTPDVIVYLDTGRVETPSRATRRVWFRSQYFVRLALGTDSARFTASEVREEVDCGERRARDLEARLETPEGETVAAPVPDAEWRTFEEHTLPAWLFDIACRATGFRSSRDRGA